MKLVTNIYHVSGNCRKASQGYRVKGQGHGSVWWWMHADRPFTVEDHLVALELIDAFHNYCRYYATKINIEDYKPITVCQTLNDCTSVRIPSCRAIINERFVKKKFATTTMILSTSYTWWHCQLTVAIVERSFSAMRHIRTWLNSSMSENRQLSLTIMNVASVTAKLNSLENIPAKLTLVLRGIWSIS